jgi:hypothetical protein
MFALSTRTAEVRMAWAGDAAQEKGKMVQQCRMWDAALARIEMGDKTLLCHCGLEPQSSGSA